MLPESQLRVLPQARLPITIFAALLLGVLGLMLLMELNLPLDWRVLGFLTGLSLLTGIVFGLVPALVSTRPEVVSALKDDSSTSCSRGEPD